MHYEVRRYLDEYVMLLFHWCKYLHTRENTQKETKYKILACTFLIDLTLIFQGYFSTITITIAYEQNSEWLT